MPRRYAVRAFAVADRNGDGHAVDNLGEPVLDDEVAALLDRRAFGRGADADGLVEQGFVVGLRRRRGHIDVGGKRVERREQVLKQGLLSAGKGLAGVGRAIGARGPRVRSEDHVRMFDEVAIDRDRFVPVLRGHDFGEVDPVRRASRAHPVRASGRTGCRRRRRFRPPRAWRLRAGGRRRRDRPWRRETCGPSDRPCPWSSGS